MTESMLQLTIRTPGATVVEQPIRSLTAEDATGRFGVRPRGEEVLGILTAGILTYCGPNQGETIVAVGPGVLHAQRDHVAVYVQEAVICGSLEGAAEALFQARHREESERAAMRDLFERLHQNLIRALAEQGRKR